MIRTEELLAARRVDRAEQFFTRAYDFGYSKSSDETLAKWGHEEILGTSSASFARSDPTSSSRDFPVRHWTAMATTKRQVF